MVKKLFRQVNWKDGMIIESDHFINLENFFIQQNNFIRKLFVNEYNYGLLPSANNETNFKAELLIDNKRLIIKELKCNAVTLDGSLIMLNIKDYEQQYIDSDNIPNIIDLIEYKDGDYDLIIHVSPFERVEYGEISTESLPYKRFNVLPKYDLVLNPITKNNSCGQNFFPIARLRIENNLLTTYDYVPPSTSLRSHPMLQEFHNFVLDSYTNIENNLKGFIKSHSILKKPSSSASNIQHSVFFNLALDMFKFTALNKSDIEYKCKYESPIFLFNIIHNLSLIINLNFVLVEPSDRDTFIKKINEELEEIKKITGKTTAKKNKNSDIDDFMTMLDNLTNFTYNHAKIIEAIDNSEKFLQGVLVLCNVLTRGPSKQPTKRQYDIRV